MTHPQLTLRHFLLALSVVFVWGVNFVVIKFALHDLPPLLFAALRFTFVFVPAVFFLKRPFVSWRNLAAYGVLIGAGQFGLLFLAMKSDISPGLASLVVQAQVFFTIGLSMLMTGERMKSYQWPALILAVAGILVIGLHTDATTTPLGLMLVLMAALSWAAGNIVGKRAGSINMLGYVVWSSPFAAVCLWALAFTFEGREAIELGLAQSTPATWAAIAWQSLANSIFGYAVWAWLLSRYHASTITPMALLVPVFGMGASGIILGEAMPAWKISAALMVMTGLALNLLWPKLASRVKFWSA